MDKKEILYTSTENKILAHKEVIKKAYLQKPQVYNRFFDPQYKEKINNKMKDFLKKYQNFLALSL